MEPNQQPIEPQNIKLPGPINLFKDSFLIYKLRFKTIIGLSLIYYIQLLLVMTVIIIVSILGIALVYALKFSIPILILVGILALTLILGYIFIQNLTILSLITSIVNYREGIGIIESFKRSFKKTIPYIWTSALVFLVTFGLILIVLLPTMLIFIFLSKLALLSPGDIIGKALITFISTVLFIALVGILTVWFFIAAYVLDSEGIGGLIALFKSREYFRGRFFSVLLRIVLLLIVITFFETGISILPKLISLLHVPYLDIIITAAISIALAPLGFIYSFIIYDNLKAFKGDFVFQPSKKGKILLLSIIFTPLIFAFILLYYIFPSLISSYKMPRSIGNYPKISISPTQNKPITPTYQSGTFLIEGQSMYPNYQNGQSFTINTTTYNTTNPSRGELIIFFSPITRKPILKRVIGIPGDKISLINNSISLNGQQLNESLYLPPETKTYVGTFLENSKEITVPPDAYFVLGDNRSFSSDSREWGYILKNDIVGKLGNCYSNCGLNKR